MTATALLSAAEMRAAEAAAIAAGTPSLTLMERAGRAVADALAARWPAGRAVVFCGPGNNGGDGYVVARLLAERGYDVAVEGLVPREALKGDAAAMAARWTGPWQRLSGDLPQADVFIDALFGIGLTRPLEGPAAALAETLKAHRARVVAVDVPSGIDADTGAVLGGRAIAAALTVTFAAKKPGHALYPARGVCGDVLIADIGVTEAMIAAVKPSAFENAPGLWRLPLPDPEAHKYARGHVLAVSGGIEGTGAARLSARAALRVGAGLVTLASPPDALAVNAAALTAIMVRRFAGAEGLKQLLADTRKNSVVLGPALGVGEATAALVRAALMSPAAITLDADGLTSFESAPDALFAAIRGRGGRTVLTPHAGEFKRLFPDLADHPNGKLGAAREAAKRAGAVVILKGADTVIAAPDGRAAVNTNAPAFLATAGAGDVLAGLVAGLMAKGLAPFEAAAAAVWLHGAVAFAFGPGLIAEDLPEALPGVLAGLATGQPETDAL
ncbi:MAG: NAD(P)H-hydrate dehydratase [Alphaproteobacteria bacterium]|nr:NAD(P)H-hydrate dehydratase [Alphaproteobacteria bacterium]